MCKTLKLLNLDYCYFMLNTVIPAKNIRLSKRNLDVLLYYCQERHFQKLYRADPEALAVNLL